MKAILTTSYSEGLLIHSYGDAAALIAIISRAKPVKIEGFSGGRTATIGGKEISIPQVELIHDECLVIPPTPIPLPVVAPASTEPTLDAAASNVLSQESAL